VGGGGRWGESVNEKVKEIGKNTHFT